MNMDGTAKNRTFAPADFEPLGPMLARRPAFAMGDSVATYESTELDWARHELAMPKATSK